MYPEIFQEGIREYMIPVNSINIHMKCLYRENASMVIFFFHGLGCSLDNFERVLKKDYFPGASLFLFDLPGFGDSDKPDDFSYTLEAFARLAGELIRPFMKNKMYLIAHSMGSGVALLLPRDILEHMSCFVCLEGNLVATDTIVSRKIAGFSREEFMTTQFSRIKRSFAFSKIMDMTRTSPKALYNASQSLVQWSDSGELLKIFLGLKCKKVYIYGEKNRDMPVLDSLSPVTTIMIPNAGHSLMVEEPERLYTTIVDFINGSG